MEAAKKVHDQLVSSACASLLGSLFEEKSVMIVGDFL
jgi:hypothetical protein